jgi:hypothetical protein
LRRLATIFLAVAVEFSPVVTDPAGAQTCYTLQAELTHLQSRGGGSSADRARYERAFREQARVLARTEARARNAGCFGGGFLFFRRGQDPACRKLVPKIGDMQTNLARLDRLRRSGGDGSARRIRQLEGAIRERGCGRGGLERWGIESAAGRAFEPEPPMSPRGTFRTLCVRTCDGYYFPISFSTTQDRFGDDAQTCSSMCPGTESKLYFHANPGGSPEEMLSIDGSAYSALPTAFQYRKSINPSCSCRPAGGYSLIASNPSGMPAEEPAGPEPSLLPRPRPEPGEDPETLANRAGAFVPGAVPAEGPATAAIATTPGGRPVRVVGPAYWGGPEQDGVVLTPVPN